LTGIKISLPSIAVIGDQSSGKSSVLQAISGVEFPTGTQCVTRCPIILQLRRGKECQVEVRIDKEEEEKALKSKNIEKTKQLIEEGTERLLWKDKNSIISKTPLNVKVTKPDLIDLTLIDLPGLTYLREGDEELSIVIKEIIKTYIKNENCLILMVAPSNQDLGNSETVQIAWECDKDCSRTLCVMTKGDLA